jgi:hypothetical protein
LNKKRQLTLYFILSISALLLIFLIGFFSQSETPTFFDKLVVGLIFILSLLFAISISIKPGWYKRQKKKKSNKFIGHHPNCDEFSNHTIIIKNKTYCSGCLGLLIGSVINIILIIYYVIYDFVILDNVIILIIGILLVLGLLFISLLQKRRPYMRVFTNFLIILSFFFIVISILEITGSYIFGLLTGLFCFLIIDTRIKISKWTHITTCKICKKECKRY